jgi:murein DD-endopeptidase MepM/ murein hydrolase activator NlpD
VRFCLPALLLCPLAWGATVREAEMGAVASDTACSVSKNTRRFESTAQQAFLRFVVRGAASGDRLNIEWIDPFGAVSASAPYDSLPASPALCFLSALPIGGLEASTKPGTWTVRVSINGVRAFEQPFEITGEPRNLAARVEKVTERQMTLVAFGASSETSINIARYTPAGGWTYVANALPESQDGDRLSVRIPQLAPAEYLVILRNPDGSQSLPARFVVSSTSGYLMPVASGEHWRVSQGPYGSYSHWGRALHAYDIAPLDGRYVTAMRAGTVRAFDLGLGQTPNLRIFGNYVTIDHGDGEYSHYAHLKTGSFRVHTGDKVEPGQVLAEVGTSGYSFGRHVHVHVTKAASISAQSVPFRFDATAKPVLISRNSAVKSSPPRPKWTGSVAFAEWWTRLLPVPKGSGSLEIRLGWEDPGSGFGLHLVSPSGHHYMQEGSGNPEALRIDTPEPGPWRVSVQAVRGGGSAPFWVEPEVRPASR